jgi:hypothetical protein
MTTVRWGLGLAVVIAVIAARAAMAGCDSGGGTLAFPCGSAVMLCGPDYCRKPMPCPPPRPALGGCGNYCPKPMPCPPPRPALGGCPDYGPKPMPNLCWPPLLKTCGCGSPSRCKGGR